MASLPLDYRLKSRNHLWFLGGNTGVRPRHIHPLAPVRLIFERKNVLHRFGTARPRLQERLDRTAQLAQAWVGVFAMACRARSIRSSVAAISRILHRVSRKSWSRTWAASRVLTICAPPLFFLSWFLLSWQNRRRHANRRDGPRLSMDNSHLPVKATGNLTPTKRSRFLVRALRFGILTMCTRAP